MYVNIKVDGLTAAFIFAAFAIALVYWVWSGFIRPEINIHKEAKRVAEKVPSPDFWRLIRMLNTNESVPASSLHHSDLVWLLEHGMVGTYLPSEENGHRLSLTPFGRLVLKAGRRSGLAQPAHAVGS